MLVLPAVLAVLAAGPAAATFADTASATSVSLKGGVLDDPSGLSAGSAGCVSGALLGLVGTVPGVDLTWTRAAELAAPTAAAGQSLQVHAGGAWRPAVPATVAASATTARVSGYLSGSSLSGGSPTRLLSQTSYRFRVLTTWGAWSSPGTAEVTRTTALCL